ncbi:hypothetical protein [Siccirubricoccus phaeus]|uniref:hypothetical protein n=1 Tax=Siccirubricoccus phaeus TaxID=2595053 RepID=UPI00165B88E1|nr:hypothetical protein [Siccirubricoccus phaeus]
MRLTLCNKLRRRLPFPRRCALGHAGRCGVEPSDDLQGCAAEHLRDVQEAA